MRTRCFPRRRPLRIMLVALVALVALLTVTSPVDAVPMINDPKGFENIPWGASLKEVPGMELTGSSHQINEYRRTNVPPAFAGVSVDTVQFSSVEQQFARVTIRYHGDQVHKHVMHYLEKQFGPVERIPGQMIRGLNQQYNWRGTETEINVTYQANTERGFIFIDSRTLAPRFNDNITDSAE